MTDLAVFGSPGMGVADVAALGTTARVWAGQSTRDWTRWIPGVRVFGLGHGTKPTDPHFGARLFATTDVIDHDHYLAPGTDSLAALSRIAAAQFGAFLLLRPYLARWLRRPAVWAPVAALNLTAMTLYCWHQTALLLVTFAGLPAGRPRGLLDAPTGGRPAYRLLWLPVFALVLSGLCALFHRFERPRRGRRSAACSPARRSRVRTDRSCPVADKERSSLGERP